MASNLVDLKLLNTAYGINKKRIDNLSEKISTKTLAEIYANRIPKISKILISNHFKQTMI